MYLVKTTDNKLLTFRFINDIVSYGINKNHWDFEFYRLEGEGFKLIPDGFKINIKIAKAEWEEING